MVVNRQLEDAHERRKSREYDLGELVMLGLIPFLIGLRILHYMSGNTSRPTTTTPRADVQVQVAPSAVQISSTASAKVAPSVVQISATTSSPSSR